MRKKLIDSPKADIKKYMMIVESAGKVPASIREDFQLEDIENPYFQGDEDTEESEGNRYYVTVGVKIGYDENTDSYFPEVIWDQETGTEIEFDKLDKISKKSIQDKCDEIGSKIHVQRKGVNESTQLKKGDKVQLKPFEKSLGQYGYNHGKTATILKTRLGSYKTLVKMDDSGKEIEVDTHDLVLTEAGINESTQIVVKALMQKFKISESKAKSIVAKVSESLKQPISESYQFSKRQNPQGMKDGEICVIKDDLNGYVKDLTYMGGDDWEPSFVRDITKAKKYIVGSEKLDDVFNNPEFNNFPDGFAFKIEPAPKKVQSESLKQPISESFPYPFISKPWDALNAQAKKLGITLSKGPSLLSSGTLVIPIVKGKIDFCNNVINTLAAKDQLDKSLTKLAGTTLSSEKLSGKPKEIFTKLESFAHDVFDGTKVKSLYFTLGANEFSSYEFKGTVREELSDKAKELKHPHLY